jgi:hypothetical protein
MKRSGRDRTAGYSFYLLQSMAYSMDLRVKKGSLLGTRVSGVWPSDTSADLPTNQQSYIEDLPYYRHARRV